jgi:hypothetical protein
MQRDSGLARHASVRGNAMPVIYADSYGWMGAKWTEAALLDSSSDRLIDPLLCRL